MDADNKQPQIHLAADKRGYKLKLNRRDAEIAEDKSFAAKGAEGARKSKHDN
jgi:hypothetical protein